MTKIRIEVVEPFPEGLPFFRVWCPACGHDDFHHQLDVHDWPRWPLAASAIQDAYLRALQMYRDHLSGGGDGTKWCPVGVLMGINVFGPNEILDDVGICTTRAMDSDEFGEQCDDCGHTNVVHPSMVNPSIDKCMFCLLESLGKEPRGQHE